ncbi:hypothetical protein [Nitrospina gracilis]|uniref:hypothetical protein n=1 Tax=Nitrospina gracilis TaxID=35801 RepID=UPI001F2C4426|nr:hypothetical protein [Nitrospina gracilis]MCF8719392.1 hypothetical protein [Nitrospina gracilis Nb-211]
MNQEGNQAEGGEMAYSPMLITKNGKYYFHIRELSLISSGDSVESAYRNLLKDKEAKLETFREIDGMDHVPAPEGNVLNQTEKFLAGNYKVRVIVDLMKYTAIALIFAFAFQFAAIGVLNKARTMMHMDLKGAKFKLKENLINPEKIRRNNETLKEGIKNYEPVIQQFFALLPIEQNTSSQNLNDGKEP